MRTPHKTLRGALLKLLLSAGTVAVCLLIIEMIFGAWFFKDRSLWFLNVPRNVELRDDVGQLYGAKDPITYRRDRYGLRGSFGSPSEIAILTVGGSTTNERFVSEGDTWSDVLSHRLADSGNQLSVANAGVDGHSTVGHIRSFDTWFPQIPHLHPCWVIVFVGVNDMLVEAHEDYDAMVAHGPIERVLRVVQYHSAVAHFYRSIRTLFGPRVAYGGGGTSGPFLSFPASDVEQDFASRVEAYGDRLRILNNKIRDFGAEPVFVTQLRGDVRRTGGRTLAVSAEAMRWHLTLELFNAKLLEVCEQTGSVCVDLATKLNVENGDFFDVYHTTPQGSRKIGDLLFRELGSHFDAPSRCKDESIPATEGRKTP